MASIPRIIIAAPHSSAGETTVATGVIAALAARRRVQPFKCGPDYIDPTYHSHAAGRPSRNLDTWMLPEPAVLELFGRATIDADIAVIEGVMGLFDGRTGEREAGSTAQLAKLLKAPVILVIDASHVARSAAAMVFGFAHFDPDLCLAGVILNRIASRGHYDAVAPPIEAETGVPVLGYLRRDDELELPERYLGLIPTVEGSTAAIYFDRLRLACLETVDFARIEAIACSAPDLDLVPACPSLFPADRVPSCSRIAVARDAAFSFYYEDNLELLRAWGAEIDEFSPLESRSLPAETSAVYIGGGFPELFARDLAENKPLRRSIRAAASRGMPVYAECGGLMYAGERLTDADEREYKMLGLVPARSSLAKGRLTLGYHELRALRRSPVLDQGQNVRAHQFHYSTLESWPSHGDAVYDVDHGARLEGFRRGSVTATYMHLHFGSTPSIAPRFVQTSADWASGEERAHGR